MLLLLLLPCVRCLDSLLFLLMALADIVIILTCILYERKMFIYPKRSLLGIIFYFAFEMLLIFCFLEYKNNKKKLQQKKKIIIIRSVVVLRCCFWIHRVQVKEEKQIKSYSQNELMTQIRYIHIF